MDILKNTILFSLFVLLLLGCQNISENSLDQAGEIYMRPRGGEFNNTVSIIIGNTEGNANVYYTLDGSEPNEDSLLYTEALDINTSVTVKAIALGSGVEDSEVITENYRIKCSSPQPVQSSSDMTSMQVLEFSCDTEDAVIHYTTDGTIPDIDSPIINQPILIESTQSLKAVALKAGFENSDTVTLDYVIAGSLFSGSFGLSGGSIIQSSEAGEKLDSAGNLTFSDNSSLPSGNVVIVQPDNTKQTIDGFGGSFTESSAYILSYLTPVERASLMNAYFGASGADYSLTRTHIASCDFSVEGRYSYTPTEDATLGDFSIVEDTKGFSDTPAPSHSGYQGVYDGLSPTDPSYDLVPMIKEALAINSEIRIIASPWSPPKWMKNNNDEFDGNLLAEHYSTFADYFSKYLSAYQAEGIDIWGITPINEPHGNDGLWESMHFTAAGESDFIANHLGPTLWADGFSSVKILGYDQNRGGALGFADAILGNAASAQYTYGTAVHWYGSSYRTFDEELDAVHNAFPDYAILHSEGCIDSLGDDEPLYSWWDDDAWWWNQNATEWGHIWAANKDNHPVYTPVHRYARNIIEGMNHWLTGWIDWNLVLDKRGGPNHVGNFCGAPVMIDPATGQVYYTPIYDVMSHFSKYIKPGDVVLNTTTFTPDLQSDVLHAAAVQNSNGNITLAILNTSKEAVIFDILIGSQMTTVTIAANAIQTIILN
ncbi:MAG: chitobiase/beta-hexosaminidase C-terminal domain-containing protein [Spirochaetaceae bacterium]|jgi:glucosylceramidase|nr:chitobiase/beta-hexosaminidase C-terminal domain-containing protein [Spirochaetaceae bacterium]